MRLVARLGLLSAALAGCGPPAAQPISPRGVPPASRSTHLGACVGVEESLLARIIGRDGAERWSAELRREEIPDPVP